MNPSRGAVYNADLKLKLEKHNQTSANPWQKDATSFTQRRLSPMGFPSVSQISRPVGRRCCEMLLKQNVFAVSVCKSVCVCVHILSYVSCRI